jgi:hypothetical protein
MHSISTYIRRHHLALVALFFAIGGGAAWAAGTITSDDIIDGEVKTADIGQNQVRSGDIATGQVQSTDVADDTTANALGGADIAAESLTGSDIANNSVKGSDVDEATLKVGPRAYATVSALCSASGACPIVDSKGVTKVTRTGVGGYCAEVAGISGSSVPAIVSVDTAGTADPEGNASAMVYSIGCPFGEVPRSHRAHPGRRWRGRRVQHGGLHDPHPVRHASQPGRAQLSPRARPGADDRCRRRTSPATLCRACARYSCADVRTPSLTVRAASLPGPARSRRTAMWPVRAPAQDEQRERAPACAGCDPLTPQTPLVGAIASTRLVVAGLPSIGSVDQGPAAALPRHLEER